MSRRWRGGERAINFHTEFHLEVRDRGLEPLHFFDFFRSHASSGGAHVLSGHDGPVRVLEAHIIKIRLLGAERTLELAYLFLEAHAAAALLDRVFVEGLGLLSERHKLVRLRGTRRRRRGVSRFCGRAVPRRLASEPTSSDRRSVEIETRAV